MTLQDRMQFFGNQTDGNVSPSKIKQANKFQDRLAAFEAKSEAPSDQKGMKKNVQKPSLTFNANHNNARKTPFEERKQVGDKHSFKFDVKVSGLKGTLKADVHPVPGPAAVPVSAKKMALAKFASIANGVNSQLKCFSCEKAVYAVEQLVIDDKVFHKNCLKCHHCQMVIKPGNYASLEGHFYCKPHLKQLFKLKGNYFEGFGSEPHKNKWLNRGETNDSSSKDSELQVQQTHQGQQEQQKRQEVEEQQVQEEQQKRQEVEEQQVQEEQLGKTQYEEWEQQRDQEQQSQQTEELEQD